VAEALRTAMRAVHPDDLICCTGSFYVAGEAKKLIQTKAV
jgi:folylpolyglutamate synthase/dihydropteroate synthase